MKLVRSAKIVVLDSDDRALLLVRSSTHPRKAGAPDLPGGIVGKSESFEAALCRELKEETGLDIREKEVTLLYNMTFDSIPGISINRLTYGARLSMPHPEVRLSYEHDEYEWVSIKSLSGLERPYQIGIEYATKHNLWCEL